MGARFACGFTHVFISRAFMGEKVRGPDESKVNATPVANGFHPFSLWCSEGLPFDIKQRFLFFFCLGGVGERGSLS